MNAFTQANVSQSTLDQGDVAVLSVNKSAQPLVCLSQDQLAMVGGTDWVVCW